MYLQQELLERVKYEQLRSTQKAQQLQQELSVLPSGHLSFRSNHYYHVLQKDGTRKEKVIPPNDFQLIRDLQEKRHIQKALPILKNNIKAYDNFLAKFQPYDILDIHKTIPVPYKDFDCSPLLLAGDIHPEIWKTEDYATNTSHPEHLIHHSEGGIITRSKSEAMIATKLEQHGLFFRYDSVEKFGAHHYSPDFKILHPSKRRIIYWEHLGLIDDPSYSRNAMDRIRTYGENGIYAGDNLIITWESKHDPLTYSHISDRIQRHLT